MQKTRVPGEVPIALRTGNVPKVRWVGCLHSAQSDVILPYSTLPGILPGILGSISSRTQRHDRSLGGTLSWTTSHSGPSSSVLTLEAHVVPAACVDVVPAACVCLRYMLFRLLHLIPSVYLVSRHCSHVLSSPSACLMPPHSLICDHGPSDSCVPVCGQSRSQRLSGRWNIPHRQQPGLSLQQYPW